MQYDQGVQLNYTGTYTKLKSGEWAIRINNAYGDCPPSGSVVLVSTKKSAPQSMYINEVFWHDPKQGIALATYTAELLYGRFGWGQAQHVDTNKLLGGEGIGEE